MDSRPSTIWQHAIELELCCQFFHPIPCSLRNDPLHIRHYELGKTWADCGPAAIGHSGAKSGHSVFLAQAIKRVALIEDLGWSIFRFFGLVHRASGTGGLSSRSSAEYSLEHFHVTLIGEFQPPAPKTILPRHARLPYAIRKAVEQGDHRCRNSNLLEGPSNGQVYALGPA